VFLRNFYVGLDYDKDLIIIGVNKGASDSASATIIGHSEDPTKNNSKVFHGLVFLMVICVIITTIVLLIYYVKFKKDNKKIEEEKLLKQKKDREELAKLLDPDD